MEKFKLNDRVKVIGKNVNGKVAFIGETQFTDGIMFGIYLDEPKGRYSGSIGGIRYFKCPKNQGVFVRQCQLKKENEVSTDDNWDSIKITSERHAYPNYLMHRFKPNLERPEDILTKPYSQTKQPDATTKELPEHKQFQKQTESNKTSAGNKLHHMKGKTNKQQLQELLQTLAEANEQVKLLTAELSKRNHQITALQRDLKKLKTYLRWNKECENKNSMKDHGIKKFLGLIVNSVIENMEDTISKVNTEKWSDFSGGNTEMMEKSALAQHIWNLEKEKKSLREFLKQITDFIMQSWKNPNPRVKSKYRGSHKKCRENTTNDSVEYLSEQLLNCGLKKHTEPGYQATVSDTKSLKKEKYPEHTQGMKESCVRKYLETLDTDIGKSQLVNARSLKNHNEQTDNRQSSCSNGSPGGFQNFRTPLTCVKTNESVNGDDSCFDSVTLSTRSQFRSLPYKLAKQRENTMPKNDLLSGDPNSAIKELHDLISNIMSNVSESCESELEDLQLPVLKQQDRKAKDINMPHSLISLHLDPDKPEKNSYLSSNSKFADRVGINLQDSISNFKNNTSKTFETRTEDLKVPLLKQQQDPKAEDKDRAHSLTSVRFDSDKLEKISSLSSKSNSEESLKTLKSDFAGRAKRKENLRKRMIYSQKKNAKKPYEDRKFHPTKKESR